MNIIYSECVSVALVIQHSKRRRRNISSCVASLALPHFFTISHKRYNFRGGGRGGRSLNIKRVF
jgi:hypothetical protein